jgi:hypothetical protein
MLLLAAVDSAVAKPYRRNRPVRTAEESMFLNLCATGASDLFRARRLAQAFVYDFEPERFTERVRRNIADMVRVLTFQNVPDQVIVYIVRAAFQRGALPIRPDLLGQLLADLPRLLQRIDTRIAIYSILDEIFRFWRASEQSVGRGLEQHARAVATYGSLLAGMAQRNRAGLVTLNPILDEVPGVEDESVLQLGDDFPPVLLTLLPRLSFSPTALETARHLFDLVLEDRQFGFVITNFNYRIGNMRMTSEQHVAHLRLFLTLYDQIMNNMAQLRYGAQTPANIEAVITQAVLYAMGRRQSLEILSELPAASLEYVRVWLIWNDRQSADWARLRELHAQQVFLETLRRSITRPPAFLTSSSRFAQAASS